MTLLTLGTLALLSFFVKTIIDNGGKQLYELAKSAVSNVSLPGLPALPGVDAIVAALIVTTVLLMVFGIVFIAILYFFGKRLFKKNVPQSAVDRLAEIRNEGIDTVYAVSIKDESHFQAWKQAKEEWIKRLRDHIKKNFPRADYLYASHLGVVPLQNNLNAFNVEHLRELCFVVRQMDIIEQILNSYRR